MRFLPLLFTVFIDSLGFGLVFPLLGPLIMNDGGMMPVESSVALRGWIFGLLISCFCLGQFFGGPILGALSDRKGRKKILLVTLVLALGGYLLGIVSLGLQSIWLFLLARLLAGIGAGNYPIAQSIMVDGSGEGEKTKNFALLGMAWGAGFILGPYFGGELVSSAYFGSAAPFWFAAALCLINIIWIWFALKESLPEVHLRKVSLLAGVEDLKKAFCHPVLRGLFLVMFIFSFGWGFFTEFSSIFLIKKFQYNQTQIGHFYAWVGIWVALAQGLFIRPFLKRFSSRLLLGGALVGLGGGLLFLLGASSTVYLFLTLPLIAFFEAFIYPTSSTIVSDLTPKEAQGEILGLHSSIQWAAIGMAPLFSGSFVALYPHLPVTVASCGILLAGLLFALIWKKKPVISG